MGFKVKHFSTVRLSVANIQNSRDWYKSFFKIEPVEDLENFASFKISNTILDIVLADLKSPLSTGGAVGYWLVDNLDAAVARANELGGRVYRGPARIDEVQKTILQIMDPYGNVFGLEADY
jgi:predicted enzyme related to lactoylglutathione lyase